MKKFILSLLVLAGLSAQAASKFKYENEVNISDYKGQTFLSLMQNVIKPALDSTAEEGFYVVDGRTAVASLKKVDAKVARKATTAAGGAQNLKAIVDAVSDRSKAITFYDLPSALAKEGVGAGRYDLTTYLGLISGGGVAVKINEENIAYNVNYGSGARKDDEKTGRSFGESPGRLALDASDKHYLETLEKYLKTSPNNVEYFYRSILEILLNNDTKNFSKITPAGQAVATDFVAVYTAEQDRHLMSNFKRHPWDIALLEVTLLSAFHAGQSRIMLMFDGKFTDATLKQAPGCNAGDRTPKKAGLVDYWQFSKSTDPANCKRSGLNVTKSDFRKLGSAISAYQRRNNPELVAQVERHFKGITRSNNIFANFTSFVVNLKTPKKLDRKTLELVNDFTAFLMQVRADANKTGRFIVEEWSGGSESIIESEDEEVPSFDEVG